MINIQKSKLHELEVGWHKYLLLSKQMLPIALQAWFLASCEDEDNICIKGTITTLFDNTGRAISVLQSSAIVSAALVSTSIKPHPRKAATSFPHWHTSTNNNN